MQMLAQYCPCFWFDLASRGLLMHIPTHSSFVWNIQFDFVFGYVHKLKLAVTTTFHNTCIVKECYP